MFNPERQYRCTIIRGRAKSVLDDLLPAYTRILKEICPVPKKQFAKQFDSKLFPFISKPSRKTLANHRTEIAGKLFGMYLVDPEDRVQISLRTEKLLETSDQPAFFKDICFKFQIPSGMDKLHTIRQNVAHKTQLRQCAYLIELLAQAAERKVTLTKNEIAYYVLNALEVLQGTVPPAEVLDEILNRRNDGEDRRVPGGSRGMQHITETLNYLQLANLIVIPNNVYIVLNVSESKAVEKFRAGYSCLGFDVSKYRLSSKTDVKKLYRDWQDYFCKPEKDWDSALSTSVKALEAARKIMEQPSATLGIPRGNVGGVEIGDEGERLVFERERQRVEKFNPRLVSKVLHLGKTKGLGYDIQSVHATPGPKAEHAIYIEVKTTKRVTAPAEKGSWRNSFGITRQEWVAAEQHRGEFRFFRVYITASGLSIFVITNPFQREKRGLFSVIPLEYRADFWEKSGGFLVHE